jgi:hypothetical protein
MRTAVKYAPSGAPGCTTCNAAQRPRSAVRSHVHDGQRRRHWPCAGVSAPTAPGRCTRTCTNAAHDIATRVAHDTAHAAKTRTRATCDRHTGRDRGPRDRGPGDRGPRWPRTWSGAAPVTRSTVSVRPAACAASCSTRVKVPDWLIAAEHVHESKSPPRAVARIAPTLSSRYLRVAPARAHTTRATAI